MDTSRNDPPPAGEPPGAPLDDDGLIAAVQAHWAALPKERRAAAPARVGALIERWPSRPTVTTKDCAEVRASILARDPGPDPSTIIDGGLQHLTSGACRVVFYDGMLGPGLEAVLRPDGRVLLLRIVEEG